MALGGSAAAAPMVSSSSSGGAGRPVSAGASVPLRRGCCCCCPFYSRGCDLNLYLSVSSLQTPPRSRHRLPCPAGRAEGAEAGGGAAAAAAPQLGAPGSALPARCAAPGAVRAGGGVTWPPSRCPRRRPRSAAPRPGPARPRRRPAAPPEQVRAAGTRSSSRGGRAAWRGGECYLSMAFYAQIGFLNFYFTRKGGNECLSQLPFLSFFPLCISLDFSSLFPSCYPLTDTPRVRRERRWFYLRLCVSRLFSCFQEPSLRSLLLPVRIKPATANGPRYLPAPPPGGTSLTSLLQVPPICPSHTPH